MMATVDGLILASPRMDDDNIRALARDKPVVVINREVDGVPCVVPDVNKGISEAVRSLAANGHTKVAFVAGPPQSWMSARRWEGVQAACEWSRLEAVRLESTKPTVDGGRQVARDVRASGATAVLTYNDLLAIGLMQELQAAGMVVPDQISIVGFDDIFGADFTTPPLTTVRSPLGECGSGAATRCCSWISCTARGRPPPPCASKRSWCCAARADGCCPRASLAGKATPQLVGNLWQPVDKCAAAGRTIELCHSRLPPTQTGSCPRIPERAALRANSCSRVQDLPIISPHGHVDAAVIEHNTPFPDPAALLVSPDHYVTRLIHASGVPLDRLRGSKTAEPDSRARLARVLQGLAAVRGHRLRLLAPHPVRERLRPPAGDQRRDRRCQLRRDFGQAAGARLPAPPALQGLQHRGPGHHGRPPRQPRQPPGDRRRTPRSTAASCRPSARTPT